MKALFISLVIIALIINANTSFLPFFSNNEQFKMAQTPVGISKTWTLAPGQSGKFTSPLPFSVSG